MHFDCSFSDAQVTGNSLVRLAGDDMFEHFPLTWCERVETRADFGKFGLFSAGESVSFNRHANGCKQVFIVHGLSEEITRAAFHRLHALRNITVTGQKNNGQDTAFCGEDSLEFETMDGRHIEIEHETARCVRIILRQKFRRRRKRSHSEASRTQQTRDGATYRRVIVHNKDGGAGWSSHQFISY